VGIAQDIRKSHFNALIPTDITFDFFDYYKRGIIKEKPTVLNKITITALATSSLILDPVGYEKVIGI